VNLGEAVHLTFPHYSVEAEPFVCATKINRAWCVQGSVILCAIGTQGACGAAPGGKSWNATKHHQ